MTLVYYYEVRDALTLTLKKTGVAKSYEGAANGLFSAGVSIVEVQRTYKVREGLQAVGVSHDLYTKNRPDRPLLLYKVIAYKFDEED
jgi:hypothetical protein